MFIVASRVARPKKESNVLSRDGSIVVVADTDLFSECLVEALGKKFPAFDVVSAGSPGLICEDYPSEVKLVLVYRLSGPQLEAVLQDTGLKHPGAQVALVIDAIDMLETYLKQLVETRIIDGVLPLSLRLDVFMAAVDLLMKGGEHFPSALMGKLTEAADISQQAIYDTRGETARKDEFSMLTTREVQILDLLCKGTQNKIIADRLHLSENTVKVHVRNIYKKMNVRNRTEAVSRFFSTENNAGEAGRWRN